jgi:hypothetical protein
MRTLTRLATAGIPLLAAASALYAGCSSAAVSGSANQAPTAPRPISDRLLAHYLAEVQGAKTPEIVGNATDPGATVTGTLKGAQGSFVSEYGGANENDSNSSAPHPGSNSYTLQMNTNLFTSPACNVASCKGWEQLVYDPQIQQAYIEFSLVGYSGNCPSGWSSYTTKTGNIQVCFFNTTTIPVPAVPAASLAGVKMIATTNATTDTLTMVVNGTSSPVLSLPSVLGLAGGWQYAEFNVFGEDNGTQASFTSPTSLEVQVLTQSASATRAAPTCPGGSPSNWNTTETNTLSLVGGCCAFGGDQPGIQFFESNVAGATAPACPTLTATPSPVPVPAGSQNYTTLTVTGNLVGQTSNAALQPKTCQVVGQGGVTAWQNTSIAGQEWFLDAPASASPGSTLSALATCDISGPTPTNIPIAVQSSVLVATPSTLSVTQGSCGILTASINPNLIVPPLTINATSSQLPSGTFTAQGSNTADDLGSVTFSVCPPATTSPGSYAVAITSSGNVPADANSTSAILQVTPCTPESPAQACASSSGLQTCGTVSLGCGYSTNCGGCAGGTSCTSGVCCPSGETYQAGFGCQPPCPTGTSLCPATGGCATAIACSKASNGGNSGNCAKTHSCY